MPYLKLHIYTLHNVIVSILYAQKKRNEEMRMNEEKKQETYLNIMLSSTSKLFAIELNSMVKNLHMILVN